ncbi:MAG: hypothetical protein ACLSH8_06885, partial [Zhenhengia sp.]|uniref:hypothetical protein n=1 Tax=Zhenhengia sp. TaxID=2944208 RepID=UPI0039913F8F
DRRIIIEQKDNYIEEQRKELEDRRIIIEQKDNYIEEQRSNILFLEEKISRYENNKLYKFIRWVQLAKSRIREKKDEKNTSS